MKPYIPVSCQLYDTLESLAVQHHKVVLLCLDPAGRPQQREGQILQIFSRLGAEFLVLDDGTEIRLDQILQVNGKRPSLYC